MPKHDINDKLNTSFMSQCPDKTMHDNSGHFVKPNFEPHYVVRTFVVIPIWLKGKAFTKTPMCLEQCKRPNGDKTLSAIN